MSVICKHGIHIRSILPCAHCVWQPKGSMCMSCRHRNRPCNSLKFNEMPAIKLEDDGRTVVVKCTEFERREPAN